MAGRIGPLPTIIIGTQKWMLRDLDVTTYRNGDPIPEVTDNTQWANLPTGAWCYYNNDPANGDIYGKLYNWYAVNDPRGLAPIGWHIPSDVEWGILITTLGGFNAAGELLKETGTSHWAAPNLYSTNSSRFTALPGGWRTNSGTFSNISFSGFWWTSFQNSVDALLLYLIYDSPSVYGGYFSKRYGSSVRCIKD